MEKFKPKKENQESKNISFEQIKNLSENIEETKNVLTDYTDNPDSFEKLTDEEERNLGSKWKKVAGGFMAFIGGVSLTALAGGAYEQAIKVAQENEKFFNSTDEVFTTQVGMTMIAILVAYETILGAKWLFEKKKVEVK